MSKIEIEKFALDSMDIKQEQISKLKYLFPEVFTEGDKIDWEKLKTTLGENIDAGKERFGLNWAGKSNCFKLIQQPSTGTLIPAKDESINFETTENLFIEGDNLEVLKLLQKAYFGKVKMIYIDPPYNTGKDFVYSDDFKDNLQNYLEITGQVDSEGRRVTTNVESDGRFHSNWLNMMYPRLFLARNLLREDGVIFISIDDNEVHNLRAICNEIFGEENLVVNFVWEQGRKSASSAVAVNHEYCLVYSKNKSLILANSERNDYYWKSKKRGLTKIYSKVDELNLLHGRDYLKISTELKAFYSALDNSDPAKAHKHYNCVDERGVYFPADASAPDNPEKRSHKQLVHPNGKLTAVPKMGWRFTEQTLEKLVIDGRIHFGTDETKVPCIKRYLVETEHEVVSSVFYKDGRGASQRLENLLGGKYFDFPKDEFILADFINYCISESDVNEVVLDFFAGSCSIAHAVFNLNAHKNTNRRFICVQLPEPTEETSEAYKADYKNIAEIGKERIRRVIKNTMEEQEKKTSGLFDGESRPLDLGFKVFKLQPSNFSTWDPNVEKSVDALTEQLFRHVDHLSPEAAQDAILYELLLKAGFELTTEITKLTLADKTVFSIMDNTMLICLERNLTNELLKAIAELKPAQFICLDEGFRDNDQLKSNAVLLMKQNGVQKFQTV